MSTDHDVVVTGIGATTPIGGTAPETWQSMLDGTIGVKALTEPWADKYQLPVRIYAPLAVDPLDVLPRVEARRLDRCQQVALIAAREAWADAGAPELDPERLGVVVGTGIGAAVVELELEPATADAARVLGVEVGDERLGGVLGRGEQSGHGAGDVGGVADDDLVVGDPGLVGEAGAVTGLGGAATTALLRGDAGVLPVGLGAAGPLVGAGGLAWRLLGRDVGVT